MLQSILCRREHFDTEWFAMWLERMNFPLPATNHLHRKVWEWSAISQALHERAFLTTGKRGLGFAVGTEPVVSLYASLGAEIEATDLASGEIADIWNLTNQHAHNKESLFRPDIINNKDFNSRVSFFNADMNNLSNLEREKYDFIWSSCAIEHLGTLQSGLDFVANAMDLLKPGGIACHTTEFNISNEYETIESGINVLYRESDLRRLDRRLREKFCCIEDLDLKLGTRAEDVLYDIAPYGHHGRSHIKLLMDGFITTSLLLICRKFG